VFKGLEDGLGLVSSGDRGVAGSLRLSLKY